MQAQIADAMSRLEEDPTSRAEPNNQAAQLQQQVQLAKILEEEMTHHEQVSVLSRMHLQQAEEAKARAKKLGNYRLWWNNNRGPLKI